MAMTKILSNPSVLFLLAIAVLAYFAIVPSIAPAIAIAMDKSSDAIMPITSGSEIDHANKHGLDAELAEKCFNSKGTDLTYDKLGDKKIDLCLTEEGLAIRVCAKKGLFGWCQITEYFDRNIKTIEDAIGYAEQDKGDYGTWSYLKDCWRQSFPNIKY